MLDAEADCWLTECRALGFVILLVLEVEAEDPGVAELDVDELEDLGALLLLGAIECVGDGGAQGEVFGGGEGVVLAGGEDAAGGGFGEGGDEAEA